MFNCLKRMFVSNFRKFNRISKYVQKIKTNKQHNLLRKQGKSESNENRIGVSAANPSDMKIFTIISTTDLSNLCVTFVTSFFEVY